MYPEYLVGQNSKTHTDTPKADYSTNSYQTIKFVVVTHIYLWSIYQKENGGYT